MSIASAVRKSQFICQTVAEYQRKAVYWATHGEELIELRQQLINNRPNLPLFDLANFVSNLESAYQQMWQSHQEKEMGRLGDGERKRQKNICYQIVEDLKVDVFEKLDRLTYPSLKQHWQYQQPQGELIGIVAKTQDRNVGLIVAEIDRSTPQAKILSFFVLPQYRQQGIGTELMQRLTDFLSLQCGQITVEYRATDLTELALESILARQKWRSPKTTFTLVKTDIKIAQAPWLYKYPLPNSFTIFPWTKLTATEKAELAQRRDYPPSLSPLTKDPRLESLNSLGLRYRGKIIGWCLTHRIDKDTIRYSTLYVEPKFQKLGRGISLVAEAIKRQMNHGNIPYGKWSIAPDNHLMSRFNRRHLLPYSIFASESRRACKDF